jgi:protease-4
VVELTGEITDGKKILEQLEDFRDEDGIKAIVVRIDSPGGAVAPSQEIYEAIRKIREKKKVVASMGSLAASGGYYVACAADKIYADPGTLTGSIGVIMQVPNVTGLMQWAGVKMNTLTAGKMKDSLSPFRELRPDERTYYEGVLEDVHEQFIGAVAAGRGLKVDQVRPLADGRVFTGRQAKALKLVDELGGLSDAVKAAGKLAGLGKEPEVEYPRKKSPFLEQLMGEDAQSLFHGLAQATSRGLGGVGLEYRLPATP